MAWTKRDAIAAAGLIVLAAGAAAAATPTPGAPMHDVQVANAWSRPTAKGLPTGVVYMTLSNPGPGAARLVGASTPVAQRMELHRSSMSNGVMSMAAVPGGLEIPAGGHVALAPNGYHFMLTGLKQALDAGTTFPATLTFAHGGQLRIKVSVRAVAPEPTPASPQ